ncbi:Putative ATP adenylyltransferase [Photobacterium marinum]|uniref:Putative ATP adenylyltransferase n=1 Tax=Photobacterium marinum TaxID=1056511 RepID=L8JD88_9GAMM|nr:ATP adenylyltransferase [Photobacterium marinum]ELR65519.1 Putative ATP adenylyltransferase [Photobacterium marinum]
MFWDDAVLVSEKALAGGELMPITTEAEVIQEHGVNYLGYVVTQNARKKPIAKTQQANPFLPYEPAMYVGEAGKNHVCLLNKFPVISPHLLICSKEFVAQSSPLTSDDFKAWLLGFSRFDVLGFYNSGPEAGASQLHRHMQIVRADIPMEPVISSGKLPFKHCLFVHDELNADRLYQRYMTALELLSLNDNNQGQCLPHNILLTARWMLVLPRSINNIEGVFANALNYSGRFLVKEPKQLEWLQRYGIMRYLSECSVI